MDEITENLSDQTVLEELLENERLIEHPTYGTVKLQRPTPRKERQINDLRSRYKNADLRARDENGNRLYWTRAALEQEAIENGSWSVEKQTEMNALRDTVGECMLLLEASGFETVESVLLEYQTVLSRLQVLYAEKPEVALALNRYFHLDLEQNSEDERLIRKESPSTEADDLKEQAQILRKKLETLYRLADARRSLNKLMAEYSWIVKDSIEARVNRIEQLANLYYCATKSDGQHLWPTFDQMWDADARDIEYLLDEMYYFNNMLSNEFKSMMDKHGFTARVPGKTSSESSAGSPEHPMSNSAGGSQESAPSTSSGSTESAETP